MTMMQLLWSISIIFYVSSTSSLEASSDAHSKLRNSSSSRRESREDDLEMSLRYLERKRLTDIQKDFKDNNIKVAGFYHTSKWKAHWESVIGEQLRLMDGNRFKSYTGTLNDKWGSKYWASLLDLVGLLHFDCCGQRQRFERKYRKLYLA